MTKHGVAIVGAAETTRMGRILELSNLGLNADAAINAMQDADILPTAIDGLACGYENPADVANYLGIHPVWTDNTSIGGCSWMIMLRHASAALAAGLCTTVLITHGESGRSQVGGPHYDFAKPGTLTDQFEFPYGMSNAASMLGIPAARYMKLFEITEKQLAYPAVIHREWAALNPRAQQREAITVDDVLNSPMIAWPFRKLMCCLVSDGGGALVVTSAERAKDYPQTPVYVTGTGEAYETYFTGIANIRDPLHPEMVRTSTKSAMEEARIDLADVDHLMVYDAFTHCPILGLEGLGFCRIGEGAAFIEDRITAPGGHLPMNTNGGGLSYAHTGSYGMLLLQEAVRQLRGTAAAQVPGAKTSLCLGWGGFFASCATIILSNEAP